jgi:nitroimidazol reductase NimA-like FMN-containing flavoprotein (pyridoxamine 5'-phosphate oxidase superfamily)
LEKNAETQDRKTKRMSELRRNDREIKDLSDIEAIIHSAAVCHIGMCDGALPYIVAVNFGYRNRKLYFHCARQGKKLDIISRNPAVCVQFESGIGLKTGENSCDYGYMYQSVVGMGIARLLTNEAEKIEGLTCIMAHYARGIHTFDGAAVERVAVVAVTIDTMTGKQSGY